MPLPNVPFVFNPQLTAISIAYQNEAMIADQVLPRVPTPPAFTYSVFDRASDLRIADTKVGRTSRVNEIDYSATSKAGAVTDHALQEPVPRLDQRMAAVVGTTPNIDPLGRATTRVTSKIDLDREQRAANVIFNPATYATGNKELLSGTTQWSDYVNSDPLADIMTAIDTLPVRPNQMVLGRVTWSKLRRHPKLISASNSNPGQYGMISQEFLASLLEVDEIVVGEGWVNIAVKGQAENRQRLWGNHAALLYKAPVSVDENTMTFGITAQWETRQTFTFFDENVGLRGADIVRVGESVQELVLANDLGYFFQNAVATP